MPRVNRPRKQRELFLIREFCHVLGYKHFRLRASESPDAFLYIRDGRIRKCVGMEQTDYFNDTVHGAASPSTPIADFWKETLTSLMHRISHRKHLTGLFVNLRLKGDEPKRPEHGRSVAKELVEFVEANPAKKGKWRRFAGRAFDGYPELQSCLSSINLVRQTYEHVPASRCSWVCSNLTAGHVATVLQNIKSAIEEKNKRPQRYDWKNANERWLLISAASDTVSRGAGPAWQSVEWDDTGLRRLCRDSLFDRIVFWERRRSWYKWVKPPRPIVEYEEQRRSR